MQKKTPSNLLPNLRLFEGKFPYLPRLRPSLFSGILPSGVLHYLHPLEVLPAFKRVFDLLKPGGKFFFHTSTPYIKVFEKFYPIYEENLRRGDLFPGHILNPGKYVPSRKNYLPKSLILMDQKTVEHLMKKAGFHIESLSFVEMSNCPEDFQGSGKEYIGVIGVKKS